MKLLNKIYSKTDNTVKYIFNSNGYILEFSYINKNDGKDIICVPCATTCNLGCKFCHLTGLNIKLKNLSYEEILYPIQYILSEQSRNNVLLISFMGCGEPLYNIKNVIQTSIKSVELFSSIYKVVRFGLASLIPTYNLFDRFYNEVKNNNLKMKFHYSLHSTKEELRKELMPGASKICIDKIQKYIVDTNNSAEIHYSLISGVNDSFEDLKSLINLLQNTKIAVKLLKYNEKQGENLNRSDRVFNFLFCLQNSNIITEYYEPPGSDIGSSCGQFLLDYYKEFK